MVIRQKEGPGRNPVAYTKSEMRLLDSIFAVLAAFYALTTIVAIGVFFSRNNETMVALIVIIGAVAIYALIWKLICPFVQLIIRHRSKDEAEDSPKHTWVEKVTARYTQISFFGVMSACVIAIVVGIVMMLVYTFCHEMVCLVNVLTVVGIIYSLASAYYIIMILCPLFELADDANVATVLRISEDGTETEVEIEDDEEDEDGESGENGNGEAANKAKSCEGGV